MIETLETAFRRAVHERTTGRFDVGASGPLPYRQDEKGLHVTIPAGASHDFGVVLRIQGDRLV